LKRPREKRTLSGGKKDGAGLSLYLEKLIGNVREGSRPGEGEIKQVALIFYGLRGVH